MKHVVWDWNGTLLDDTDAALGALNAMLGRRGKRPVPKQFYRERFAFPVRPFYSECGFELENEDWASIAVEYHEAYGRGDRKLATGAIEALRSIRANGVGQSLLSALRQDRLEADARSFGVDGFFEFVRGTDNLDGASKTGAALRLARDVRAAHPGEAVEFVMIGDAIHDKEVADAIGARCVLFSGGSHSAARLEPLAPVFDTLADAACAALGEGDRQM